MDENFKKEILKFKKMKIRKDLEAHHQLGMHKEAVLDCERLIGLDEDDPESYLSLGFYLEKSGEIYKAMECYQNGIERFPFYAEYYTNLGYCFEIHNKQPDKALSCYGKALKVDPFNYWALNNVGHIYQKEGKWQDALYYYEQAEEVMDVLDYEYRVVHNLAWACYHCRNYEDAWRFYDTLVEVYPDNMNILGDFSCVKYKMGFFNDALELLYDALLIDPKNRRCQRLYKITMKKLDIKII
jgi:superkiller protein 3